MDIDEFYQRVGWDYHVEELPEVPYQAQQTLRNLGKLGWELVAVVYYPRPGDGRIVAYCKKFLDLADT